MLGLPRKDTEYIPMVWKGGEISLTTEGIEMRKRKKKYLNAFDKLNGRENSLSRQDFKRKKKTESLELRAKAENKTVAQLIVEGWG